jgi:hypothetical protein
MVANYFYDLPDDLQNTIQVMVTHKMYDDVLEEMTEKLTERYRQNNGGLFLFWRERDCMILGRSLFASCNIRGGCLIGDPTDGMVWDEDYGWVWM